MQTEQEKAVVETEAVETITIEDLATVVGGLSPTSVGEVYFVEKLTNG